VVADCVCLGCACAIVLQAADSVEAAKAAPFVEKLVADGYEVLYLTEAIDEAMVTNLAKFGELELVDVSKEGINLGDEDSDKKVRQPPHSLSGRVYSNAWDAGLSGLEGRGNSTCYERYSAARSACWQSFIKVTGTAGRTSLAPSPQMCLAHVVAKPVSACKLISARCYCLVLCGAA
jgi:hypothetical protein